MATIPLGLGLATVSHLYLCHRNLVQAEQERQVHIELSERCELDLLFQSLSGKALFSELIDLLDSTLLFHSGSNDCSCNGGDDCNNAVTIGQKKRKKASRSSPRHRRYQQQQQDQDQDQNQRAARPRSMLLSSSTVKNTGRGVTSGERNAKVLHIDMQPQQTQDALVDQSSRDTTPKNVAAAIVASSRCQTPSSPSSPQNQAIHGKK